MRRHAEGSLECLNNQVKIIESETGGNMASAPELHRFLILTIHMPVAILQYLLYLLPVERMLV